MATVVNSDESTLLLSCLLFGLSSAIAAKGADPPPLQAQPTPTANTTGQCSAGYLQVVQGPSGSFRVLQEGTGGKVLQEEKELQV